MPHLVIVDMNLKFMKMLIEEWRVLNVLVFWNFQLPFPAVTGILLSG